MPKCGRCVKRKKEDECVYLPSPMTKRPRLSEDVERLSPLIEQDLSAAPANRSKSVESPGGYRAALFGGHPSAMIGPALHTHEPSPTADLSGSAPDGYIPRMQPYSGRTMKIESIFMR